ncbi:hypothetical protein ACL2XP_19745 [Sodalis sp. RH21]|uniref:hypothetical protein n=1 Tax=unclassified Sodalis (in: enterobacteria) TaxID=2636512 RepID=UPI0039B58467
MFAKSLFLPGIAVLSVCFAGTTCAQTQIISDEQVRQQIINDSIASYPGNCPCPYNSARNGGNCGKRSAWSRAGGHAPICYKNEVTKNMVANWRNGHG